MQILEKPIRTGKAICKLLGRRPLVVIDDLPVAESRYGFGKPPHPMLQSILERHGDEYRRFLNQTLELSDELCAIPNGAGLRQQSQRRIPAWSNAWFPPLDAATLYTMLVSSAPQTYLEIGSGHSTMFARQAINCHDLPTRIVSIDPEPRIKVDCLCDEVHRQPLEDTDLAVFDQLDDGDILFVDSSHRVLMNSDVEVIFLEVLPRLKPGVLVHFHDIWLPYDYPQRWADRCYSEQYMLSVLLLFGRTFEIVLANRFIAEDDSLSQILRPLWARIGLGDESTKGGSFWIRRRTDQSKLTQPQSAGEA